MFERKHIAVVLLAIIVVNFLSQHVHRIPSYADVEHASEYFSDFFKRYASKNWDRQIRLFVKRTARRLAKPQVALVTLLALFLLIKPLKILIQSCVLHCRCSETGILAWLVGIEPTPPLVPRLDPVRLFSISPSVVCPCALISGVFVCVCACVRALKRYIVYANAFQCVCLYIKFYINLKYERTCVCDSSW